MSQNTDAQRRVETLTSLGLRDGAPDGRFDRVARLAAAALGVPIAVVSLCDDDRQTLWSAVGIADQTLPLWQSPCAVTLAAEDVVVVPDTREHPATATLPVVSGAPGVRFYAGHPLRGPNGLALGTVAVMAPHPRTLDETERQHLRDLAAMAEAILQTSRRATPKRGTAALTEPPAVSEKPAAAVITCSDAGVITDLSPTAQRLFGRLPETVVGQPLTLLLVGREGDGAADLLSQLLARAADGPARRNGRRSSGESFPLEYEVTPQKSDGETRYAVEVRDKSAQQEAERLRREVLATVSHRLRTPLTSLRGALKLLNQGSVGELPDQARHLLGTAERNADRMARLISDILDLEDLESGRLRLQTEQVDLGALVAQACESLQSDVDALAIRLKVIGGAGDVVADPDRLLQVLQHLLRNAVTYAPAHSTVRISLSRQEHQVEVRVQDDGCGIAPEHQAIAFERFWQAPGQGSARTHGEGAGLGLAICKAIVRLHHGTIGLTSTPGTGTTVWFRLPV